jgi:hypothetical protein
MRPYLSRPFAALFATALAGLVAACDLGPGPSPAPSLDPSASPIITTQSDFCAALDVLHSEHVILRQIRLRPGNRRALDDQYEQVRIAWEDMVGVVPRGLKDQLDALRWAVIDLGIAVEDYTTTSRFDEAAEHVLREDIAFDRTLGRLRDRTTCPAWQPTPKPVRTPTPGPSTSPSPSPEISGATASPSGGPS